MIREFKPSQNDDDLNRLLNLYHIIFATEDGLQFLTYTLKPFDGTILREWFTTHERSGVFYFGKTDDSNDLLGLCIIQKDPVKGIELLGLMVPAEQRNKGIGRELIRFAVDHARTSGFKAIDVFVFADNKRMLRLAIGCDFIPVDISHRVRADGGDVLKLKHYLHPAD